MEPNSKLNDIQNKIKILNNEINQLKPHFQEQKNDINKINHKFNLLVSMISQNDINTELNNENINIRNPYADKNGNLANLKNSFYKEEKK